MNPEDAPWFQKLRDELLKRKFPFVSDYNGLTERKKLTRTLADFFPQGWDRDFASAANPIMGLPARIGEHLIFCNPLLGESKLLPDGTDKLHSPGDPYVRRMWAGGLLNVHHGLYFNLDHGWYAKHPLSCLERIKDVRLRGQGDNEKIFVTIAREFARYLPHVTDLEHKRNILLTEERNLVFMRERSGQELDDIEQGKIAPVKYLSCEFIHWHPRAMANSSSSWGARLLTCSDTNTNHVIPIFSSHVQCTSHPSRSGLRS